MKNKVAIMIDVGGVLVDVKRPTIDGFNEYNDALSLLSRNSVGIREILQVGGIGVEDFYANVTDILPEVSQTEIDLFENAWLSPIRKEVAQAINCLRGCDLFIGSNTHQIHWKFLERIIRREIDAMGCFLSFEEGLMKPNPLFFRRFVDRYCGYESYILIDDRLENLASAGESGMKAIHFDNDNYSISLERIKNLRS